MLSSVRSTLRIKWYRSSIEREKLSKFMKRSNFWGVYQAVGHLALWTTTGLLSYTLYTQ